MRYIFSFIFSVDAVLFELMNRCMLLLTDKRIQSTSSFIGKKKLCMPQSLSPNCFICLSSFPRLPHQKLTFIYKDRYQGGKKISPKENFRRDVSYPNSVGAAAARP